MIPAALLSAACVDVAEPLASPGGGKPSHRLSELGVFAPPLAALQPTTGFQPYDVNVSLYADNAQKERLFWLPPGTRLGATADRWEVPVGAYFVKTFFFPNDARDPSLGRQLLETRFLVRTAAGYDVSTYLWNREQTDATVSGGNVDLPVEWIDADGALQSQTFHVPGTSLCQSCHGDRALGIRTRQLDLPGVYADGTSDQLTHLVAQGLLDVRPPAGIVLQGLDTQAPLEARARSYLDGNCSHCHDPGGIAEGTHVGWGYADPLSTCTKVAAAAGTDRVLVPGEPDASQFLARMRSLDAFTHMPQGESHVPDAQGIGALSQWVQAMAPRGCP